MDSLVFHERPLLRAPVMVAAFAGWPDAHEAATTAVRHLARKLPARRFAELDPEEFYTFARLRPNVRVDADGGRHLQWPVNDFHYWRCPSGDRDLVVFSGTEPHLRWRTYVRGIIEAAERVNVQGVIVVGSLLAAIPHTREPRLTGTAAAAGFRDLFRTRRPSRAPYQGPASIGTVLMDECSRRRISVASLWGHSPHYLQTSANPWVARAILQQLVALLGLDVDMSEIAGACTAFGSQVDSLLSARSDIGSYVRRLEERYDRSAEGHAGLAASDLPSPDLVIAELEEYLRRRHPGGTGPSAP